MWPYSNLFLCTDLPWQTLWHKVCVWVEIVYLLHPSAFRQLQNLRGSASLMLTSHPHRVRCEFPEALLFISFAPGWRLEKQHLWKQAAHMTQAVHVSHSSYCFCLAVEHITYAPTSLVKTNLVWLRLISLGGQ